MKMRSISEDPHRSRPYLANSRWGQKAQDTEFTGSKKAKRSNRRIEKEIADFHTRQELQFWRSLGNIEAGQYTPEDLAYIELYAGALEEVKLRFRISNRKVTVGRLDISPSPFAPEK